MLRPLAVALALATAIGAGCSGSHPNATPDASDTDAGAPDAGDTGAGDTSNDAEARDAAKPSDTVADALRDAGPADADAHADANAHPDADAAPADVHLSSFCDLATQTLPVPSAPLGGTLSGASRNPAVSCHTSVATKGPDAFYSLTVSAYTIVEITVASTVDTLVAVRTGCGDDAAEVACGDLPPDTTSADGGTLGGFDAGAIDAGTSNLRFSSVRVGLAPGTYTVIVDTLTLGSLTSAPFTIGTTVVPPADNAACAAPTLLVSEESAQGNLDFAGPSSGTCGGSMSGALFYAVGVPAGDRLTVRATPTAGDRGWLPTMSAFAACGGTACLAQGRATAGATQQLDWVNNGSNWRLVTFSIGADSPVKGGQFAVTASVTDLLASCDRPTPVHDGTLLTNQNLQDALTTTNSTCDQGQAPALYYAASLLPQQEIDVQAIPSDNNANASFDIALRTSCTDSCANGSGGSLTNVGSEAETVIIEVTGQNGVTSGGFNLEVSIPLPPAGITVTPTSGLVTTESGGTATFQVVLTSPPTAPVTIGVASNTPTEGKATPSSLVFDATTWSVPQTVTVTGVDDTVSDGARSYLVVTAPATSTDGRYAALDADDVEVTNLDNDPGLTFDGADLLVTSEDGTSASFGVRLNRKPTDNVKVPLTSSNTGEGTVSPASLTFTPANWNTDQTVTVTGVNDAVTDGTKAYAVVTGTLVSNDAAYGGQNPPDVAVHNLDDDYKAVALKLVSGDGSCGAPTNPAPIVVDALNTLYLVLDCDNQLSVLTSLDGGVTFSAPVPVPGTSSFTGTYVAAAGGDTLYVAVQMPNQSFEITRTSDGGATWSPLSLLATTGPLFLSAGASTVVAMSPSPNGDDTIVQRSLDGGRTFTGRQTLAFPMSSFVVEPDGETVWVSSFVDPTTTLLESSDAGASFTAAFTDTPESGISAIGHQTFVEALSDQTRIINLADPTMVASGAPPTNFPSMLVFDDRDGLTGLGQDQTGTHTVATRIDATATAATSVTIGPRADAVAGVALSRSAVASLLYSNGLVFYVVTTF